MNDLTVGQVIESLGFRNWLSGRNGTVQYEMFTWPPDVFALAATLLRDSGAYLHAAKSRQYDKSSPYWLEKWVSLDKPNRHSHIARAAHEWRSLEGLPAIVQKLLTKLAAMSESPLWMLSRHAPDNFDWLALVQLLAIADETCRGIGLLYPYEDLKFHQITEPEEDIRKAACEYPFNSVVDSEAMQYLSKHAQELRSTTEPVFNPTTLCRRVSPSRAIVLPKMRTSQRGITIRSFSHHLALLNGTDVEPQWHNTGDILLANANRRVPITRIGIATRSQSIKLKDIPSNAGPYNIILFPWPERLTPAQFSPLPSRFECLAGRPPEGDAFFKFVPAPIKAKEFRKKIESIHDEAVRLVGPIHGFVMPEMAMRSSDFMKVFDKGFLKKIDFVACGVYDPPADDSSLANNYAIIRRTGRWNGRTGFNYAKQYKHHRWALDSNQVAMYRLGSALRPGVTWWEGIDLPRRVLHFFALDASTAFTVLICEDLARPDPVADAVRAVGPNLVICLLLDGPQLASRWSARYATVLADDPGSSVITLSSLGMVRLSRTRDEIHKESRVIGLWREPGGSPVELYLDEHADALVLSLSSKGSTERTIDGRGDEGVAGQLHLTGVHALTTQPKTIKKRVRIQPKPAMK